MEIAAWGKNKKKIRVRGKKGKRNGGKWISK